MTPLRIHFFTNFVQPQGTYFRFHNLARGLSALGHRVEVFACDLERAEPKGSEVRDGIPYHITPISKTHRVFSAGSDPVTALRQAWSAFPPCDIAHLFQPFLLAAGGWWSSRARARLWDWDDLWTHEGERRTLRPLRRHWPRAVTNALEHTLPRAADHVTAIDHYLLDLARSRGARASSLLYNPSPPLSVPGRAARADFGLDPDGLYVGFLGYTTAELDWCLEGVARNLACYPRLRFVLCGPSSDALPPMSADVRARIDCLGRLPQAQARAVAGAMDLALLPLEDNPFNRSRFPVKFSEYLMAGTPVLCSEIGECGLMARQIPGALPAGRTRAEWLAAFDAVLGRAAAGRLPTVNLDAVHALFDAEVVCRRLIHTYQTVLAGKMRRADQKVPVA